MGGTYRGIYIQRKQQREGERKRGERRRNREREREREREMDRHRQADKSGFRLYTTKNRSLIMD